MKRVGLTIKKDHYWTSSSRWKKLRIGPPGGELLLEPPWAAYVAEKRHKKGINDCLARDLLLVAFHTPDIIQSLR